MYCMHCGKQIADNSRYCRYCGEYVAEDEIVIIDEDKAAAQESEPSVSAAESAASGQDMHEDSIPENEAAPAQETYTDQTSYAGEAESASTLSGTEENVTAGAESIPEKPVIEEKKETVTEDDIFFEHISKGKKILLAIVAIILVAIVAIIIFTYFFPELI